MMILLYLNPFQMQNYRDVSLDIRKDHPLERVNKCQCQLALHSRTPTWLMLRLTSISRSPPSAEPSITFQSIHAATLLCCVRCEMKKQIKCHEMKNDLTTLISLFQLTFDMFGDCVIYVLRKVWDRIGR